MRDDFDDDFDDDWDEPPPRRATRPRRLARAVVAGSIGTLVAVAGAAGVYWLAVDAPHPFRNPRFHEPPLSPIELPARPVRELPKKALRLDGEIEAEESTDPAIRFRLDQSVELPPPLQEQERPRPRPLEAPSVDPHDPNSAAAGART